MAKTVAPPISTAVEKLAIRVGLFDFQILPVEELILPAFNKPNVLRGSFGNLLRKLSCVPECRDASNCPLAESCTYKAIFAPSPGVGASRLSRNQDLPRPFVFRTGEGAKTRFEENEPFEFEVVLIGNALERLPFFVLAFNEAARQGMGLNRARCTLERVCHRAVDRVETVYSRNNPEFRSPVLSHLSEWVEWRLRQLQCYGGECRRITVEFKTPTFLRADGAVVCSPDFHHIVKRLRDRVNALSTFFEAGPLDMEFRDFGFRAEAIQTKHSNVRWVDRFRTSSRTGQRHEVSGFVGTATYEGSIGEFLPWLVLAEFIHIGRHTAWGNGWLRIHSVSAN